MAKTRARKSKKATELPTQTDPTAPLDAAAFLKAAQPVLEILTKDLLQRAEESPGIARALAARHRYEIENKLTADKLEIWRRNIVVQIAAGWLLSCVFVRTLEDRGLLPHNRIAGPGATDAQHQFSQIAPYLNERDYLRTVFAELEHVPVVKALFDREHNLIWRLAPSAEATKALLGLFRAPEASAPAFRFGQSSTRFLGDLYQDLSEEVRKRFALLQTPDFIESFILDRTLEPAVEEFGLSETSVIDPTCGSGHFLLGAFERLFEKWCAAEPGAPVASAVEKALSAVVGVDINPYAVSIARFRLTLAALEKLGVQSLAAAPKLPLSVVVADSLADGTFADLPEVAAGDWGVAFDFVDERAAKEVLRRSYEAVVGNPPYITVKDEALRERYRAMYEAAGGKYALSAPFMERFFQLARAGGFVGQITANSFMKREFGKGLVERVLPKEDVQLIVNTAGAYIPGHATPTVLVFGRHRGPENPRIQAVLARRGEPSTPGNPAEGRVWSSIRNRWSEESYEDEYITVEKIPRIKFTSHPWSLEGGGAAALKENLERKCSKRMADIIESVGRSTHTGDDAFFFMSADAARRLGIPPDGMVPIVKGEQVRDWSITSEDVVLFPYDPETGAPRTLSPSERRHYERYKCRLEARTDFGQSLHERGLQWYEHSMFFPQRYRRPLSIAFAFVATHNHFALDLGGKVFNRSAPVIALTSTRLSDSLSILAYLNSSTACFLLKQVAQVKQMTAGDGVRITEYAQVPREYSGENVLSISIPDAFWERQDIFVTFGKELTSIATQMLDLSPMAIATSILSHRSDPAEVVSGASRQRRKLRARMVCLQEDLDWMTYNAMGICETVLTEEVECLEPGQRAFELSAREKTGAQTTIDGDPIPDPEREVSQRPALRHKLQALRDSKELSLLETPDFKRRWMGTQGKFNRLTATYEEQVKDHARLALLRMIEEECARLPSPVTPALMAEWLLKRTDHRVLDYVGLSAAALQASVHKLVEQHSVPYLSTLRFSDSGRAKHAQWQQAWHRERRPTASSRQSANVVPPRFENADYCSAQFWGLRGKLDIPTEAFISYPGCESDHDRAALFGWAGWTYSCRARALALLYGDRKDKEGWGPSRLLPMLQGIAELLPWLSGSDAGETSEVADFYASWLAEEGRANALLPDALKLTHGAVGELSELGRT